MQNVYFQSNPIASDQNKRKDNALQIDFHSHCVWRQNYMQSYFRIVSKYKWMYYQTVNWRRCSIDWNRFILQNL